MGYGGSTFKILSELRRNGTFGGVRSVMDLGAQESFLVGDLDTAMALVQAYGVEHPDPTEIETLVNKRFVKYLWERAGIEYHSLDYDAQFETLMLDLNYDDVPPEHLNRYDLTTNCGTTEHVLNQMNSFRVIHDLTRPGGYMLHDLPWSGMFNHGLINYQPHLIWRLCKSNYYNWIGMWLRAETHEQVKLPDNILDYSSDKDREFYKKYFAHDGMITVVLQKGYDIPFGCPLDMEDSTMILPGTKARDRYWTLADPEGVANIESHRRAGFPNEKEKRYLAELEARCQALSNQIARMESSVFWKTRSLLSRFKRSLTLLANRRVSANA